MGRGRDRLREREARGVLLQPLDAEELLAQDLVVVPGRNPGDAAVGAAEFRAVARSGQRGS